ncbi:MAG TPA: xanthine dehydrogenase family protein molybdopterin-binding subunit [Thermotogota bacterium]|nr:xanthine dehydrogenase family protein molybdopterin-binding subunit [Thermotogota bacterium]
MKPIKSQTGIGKWLPRKFDDVKAAGTLQFTDDLRFGPELLHAAVVRSPIAHGEILSIDFSQALEVAGVVKVLVGEDFPHHFGLYLQDRTPMAIGRVRYVGEPVALVVAQEENIAREAAKKVQVQYRELEAVFDPVKAATHSGVLVHPELHTYNHVDFVLPQPHTNIGNWFKIRKGNPEEAFENAAHVFEEVVTCPQIAHGFLETHCSICQQDIASGEITIWTSSQSAFTVRDIIAKGIGFPLHKIRVIAPPIGGGFGGKAGMTIEALGLAAAMHPEIRGRPVKLFIPREEDMLTSWVRQGYVARIRMALDEQHRITGIHNTFWFDTGVSAEYGANPVRSAGYTSMGSYNIPNVWSDCYAVYTNKPFGGAYRGFGLPELMSALEVVVDIVSHRLGISPVEFRKKNMMRKGDTTCTGMPMHDHGLQAIIDRVAKDIAVEKKEPALRPGWKRGKGIALAIKAPAMPADASSSAIVKLNGDGTVEVLAATMDMGQGTYTAYAQMVSEELSIPYEKIQVSFPDTKSHPYDWQTVASRSCWSMGMAVKRAAVDVRNQLLALFSEFWQTPVDTITLEYGTVMCRKLGKTSAIDEKVQNGFKMPDGMLKGGPIIGRGSFIPPDIVYPDPDTGQSPKSVVHFTLGAVGMDLEVDPTTGAIAINRVSSGYDVGKAITPANLRGQIEGGTLQGISACLMEGLAYDEKGKLLTPDFTDYKIATTLDTPGEIISFWEEVPEELSPYGNRGVGEHSMIAPAPAINNAVFNATGSRIHSYPLSRERVFKALKAQRNGENDFVEWPYALDVAFKKAKKKWD